MKKKIKHSSLPASTALIMRS